MKKYKSLAIIAACAVFFACGVFLTLNLTREKEATAPSVTDFEGRLSDIGQLATAEYCYTLTEVADKEAVKLWGVDIPFTSGKIIYSYSGTVKAGVDFEKTEAKLDEDKKTLTITLPEPEIISSEVDFDSFAVYDERNSVFNPFTAEDFNQNIARLKSHGEEAAKERGILDRASENAKTLVENRAKEIFDTSRGYTIEVKF